MDQGSRLNYDIGVKFLLPPEKKDGKYSEEVMTLTAENSRVNSNDIKVEIVGNFQSVETTPDLGNKVLLVPSTPQDDSFIMLVDRS
jgi:hypothetical protein